MEVEVQPSLEMGLDLNSKPGPLLLGPLCPGATWLQGKLHLNVVSAALCLQMIRKLQKRRDSPKLHAETKTVQNIDISISHLSFSTFLLILHVGLTQAMQP